MKIHQPRYNQTVPVIIDRIPAQPKRKRLIHALYMSFAAYQIPMFTYFKLGQTFTVYDIPF